MKRWRNLDFEAVRASNRKQALVPAGATIIEPAGTAPGMVVPPREGLGPTFVVLPGPPRELHSMWHEATATEAFQAAVGEATDYRQEMLRLFGIPESEIAVTLREARRPDLRLQRPRDHDVPATRRGGGCGAARALRASRRGPS